MKRTYVNRLPKNEEVKKTNVKIENGELIVEVEFEEKFEPKDGDFLHDKFCDITVIYKETHETGGIITYAGINKDNIVCETGRGFGITKEYRYATPEEKSSFLERLEKECHKKWNPETKELEDIRWRAKMGERYYFVTSACDVATYEESNLGCDNAYYNLGNYFRNVEAAKKVAEQIKSIFKNSKAE